MLPKHFQRCTLQKVSQDYLSALVTVLPQVSNLPPPFSKQPQFAWLREQLAGMGTGTEPESVLWSCQLRAAHDGKACELPQGTAACGEWVFLCSLLVASLSQSCPLGASPPPYTFLLNKP